MALHRQNLSPYEESVDDWPGDNSLCYFWLYNVSCNTTPMSSSNAVPIDTIDHDYNRHLSNVLIVVISIAAAVFFVSVITCYAYAVFSVPASVPAPPPPPPCYSPVPVGIDVAAFPRSDDDRFSEDSEWLHPMWYIWTVGLDESTIRSIAINKYKISSGILCAADCSVCLREFQDGELIWLLSKCGHAFHVPCIDTWLRAHVNCPLCRAHIVDPMTKLVSVDPPPPTTAITATNSIEGSRSSTPVDNPRATSPLGRALRATTLLAPQPAETPHPPGHHRHENP